MNATVTTALKKAAENVAAIDTKSFVAERDRRAGTMQEYLDAITKADARLVQLAEWRAQPLSDEAEGQVVANMLLGKRPENDRPSIDAIEIETKSLRAGRKSLAARVDEMHAAEDTLLNPLRLAMADAVAPAAEAITLEVEETVQRLTELYATTEALSRMASSGNAGALNRRLSGAIAELGRQGLAPPSLIEVPAEVRKALEPAAAVAALTHQVILESVGTPQPSLSPYVTAPLRSAA